MTYILNIVNKLWLGELSLSRSYWFFGNIVPFFFFVVIFSAIFTFHENPIDALITSQILPKNIIGKIVIFFLYFLFFTYVLISIVGVWRSSNKYHGREIWKILSKIAIIVSGFGYLKDFIKYFN